MKKHVIICVVFKITENYHKKQKKKMGPNLLLNKHQMKKRSRSTCQAGLSFRTMGHVIFI